MNGNTTSRMCVFLLEMNEFSTHDAHKRMFLNGLSVCIDQSEIWKKCSDFAYFGVWFVCLGTLLDRVLCCVLVFWLVPTIPFMPRDCFIHISNIISKICVLNRCLFFQCVEQVTIFVFVYFLSNFLSLELTTDFKKWI